MCVGVVCVCGVSVYVGVGVSVWVWGCGGCVYVCEGVWGWWDRVCMWGGGGVSVWVGVWWVSEGGVEIRKVRGADTPRAGIWSPAPRPAPELGRAQAGASPATHAAGLCPSERGLLLPRDEPRAAQARAAVAAHVTQKVGGIQVHRDGILHHP